MVATGLIGALTALFTAYLNGTLTATREQFIDYCVEMLLGRVTSTEPYSSGPYSSGVETSSSACCSSSAASSSAFDFASRPSGLATEAPWWPWRTRRRSSMPG